MTGTALSKTAAIKKASTVVSIWGSGTSWTVCGPYYDADLSGPSTERHVNSYTKARIARTAWRASIALALMGINSTDVYAAVYDAAHDGSGPVTLAALVNVGIAESKRAA